MSSLPEAPLPTLAYALLGVLARGEQSGYDLAQAMKAPVGYFWQARHSQIYPELARLEAAGLARHRVVPQQDRPDKKVYTLTEAGRARLTAWVTLPPTPAPTRDELTLKAYSLWLAAPARAVALLRAQEAAHREQLARYEQFEREILTHWQEAISRPDTPEFATYATLRRGLLDARASVEWCAWAAEQIERALPADAPAPEQ